MKKIKCDRCGKEIADGEYREIHSNIKTPVPNSMGIHIDDCLYRPVIVNDLCAECSIQFDSQFDKFVREFMNYYKNCQ